jgi:excinuclease ABC subunit C
VPIDEKILTAPHEPGVYLFKGSGEEVIYVGKAKDLRKRLDNYLKRRDFKASLIMDYARDLEFFTVPTEREALILEESLIYKYTPRFNVLMTSDITYSYLVINESFRFPTIKLEFRRSRKMTSERLGYRVIGPFTSRAMARALYELAQKVFGIRNCKWNEKKLLSRVCNLGEIGKCSMPCVGRVSEEEYRKNVEEFVKVATSSPSKVKEYLEKSMKEASQSMQFEKAIVFRDALKEFSQISVSQAVVEGFSGIGIIAAFKDGKGVAIVYFIDGEVRDVLVWHYRGDSASEFYERVALDIYTRICKDGMQTIVFTPKVKDVLEVLGCSVSNVRPERLAMEMATTAYSHLAYKSELEEGYLQLADILNLPTLPSRIEGYDNAHFQGSYPMGGMITFIGGKPSPRHYRLFHLSPKRMADVDMMYEVITRRLAHPEWGYPSLMVIDGSKPQLDFVMKAHEDVGIEKMWRVISLDKDTGLIHFDDGRAIYLDETHPAKRFLRWVMAEAHRFINKSHRERRDSIVGIFDSVKGLGPKRMEKLMNVFGSFYGIYNASLDELIEKGGLPEDVAKALYEKLHR